jgi:hypothetical protein
MVPIGGRRRRIQTIIEIAQRGIPPLNRRILLLLTLLALALADPSSASFATTVTNALPDEKVIGARKNERSVLRGSSSFERTGIVAVTADAGDFGGDLTSSWPKESQQLREQALELRKIDLRIKAALDRGPLIGAREVQRLLGRKTSIKAEMTRRIREAT